LDPHTHIQSTPIDASELIDGTCRPDCGALATFVGLVRDNHAGRAVSSLEYTAHERIAERTIREIEQEVLAEYGVAECRVIHRLGHLEIGDVAIVAVVRSGHRAEAFAAVAEVVDRVKHRAPIWKEEHYADGTSEFVEGCSIASGGEERTESVQ